MRGSVVIRISVPTTLVANFKSSSMTNGEIEEFAGNFSFYFSSGAPFILLPTKYCGLDGVVFDDCQNYIPLDVYDNVICLF